MHAQRMTASKTSELKLNSLSAAWQFVFFHSRPKRKLMAFQMNWKLMWLNNVTFQALALPQSKIFPFVRCIESRTRVLKARITGLLCSAEILKIQVQGSLIRWTPSFVDPDQRSPVQSKSVSSHKSLLFRLRAVAWKLIHEYKLSDYLCLHGGALFHSDKVLPAADGQLTAILYLWTKRINTQEMSRMDYYNFNTLSTPIATNWLRKDAGTTSQLKPLSRILLNNSSLQLRATVAARTCNRVVIRAILRCNLPRNIVARQVARKCCPYYFKYSFFVWHLNGKVRNFY